MEAGEPLSGGNVGGAVRVGDTVLRPTGPWTPAVHEFLGHLATAGLRGVPGVHGIAPFGREVLDYLPGEVIDVDDELLSVARLASAGAWLRDFHESAASFPDAPRRWRRGLASAAPGQIVCHHDAAPYNMAFVGDELAGVFDWDMCAPGVPLDDVAFFAWNAVPLFRPRPDDEVATRLRLLASAYGRQAVGPSAREISLHAVDRMRRACDVIEAGQAAGDPGLVRLGQLAGEPARTRGRISAFERRLPGILALV